MIRQSTDNLLGILPSWLRPSEIACTKYKVSSRLTIVQLCQIMLQLRWTSPRGSGQYLIASMPITGKIRLDLVGQSRYNTISASKIVAFVNSLYFQGFR